jgi:hypothetical protein
MRLVLRLGALLLILAAATVALGSMAERWVLYPFNATETAPAEAGLAGVTALSFDNDGQSLVAWVAPPAPGKPVIFYLHGNAGNLAARAGRFRHFLDRGYGLFAPAYRGSSGSSGSPDEAALRWDAEVALHRLFSEMPALDARRVVLYGESLGTAVALSLVASPALHPEKGHGPPGGVILEAPFTSIPDLAEHHYPGTRALAERLDSTWPSLARAAHLSAPLLVLHGSDDTLIPTQMGRQITSAAPSRNKRFHLAQGAGHSDLWRTDTLAHLWRFVDQFALR